MYNTDINPGTQPGVNGGLDTAESSKSAVYWPAIIAGAVTATVSSLVLLLLGTGLGFSAMSPWENEGASAMTLGVSAVVWMIVMQWVSSALGGYLTGRLRTKWSATHTHEVFFRDTAHGFLAWALAALLTAFLMTSAISAVIKGGASAATAVAGASAAGAAHGTAASGDSASGTDNGMNYFIDGLFRSDRPAPTGPDERVTAEVTRIFARSVQTGDLPQGDRDYVARVVAARTSLTPAEASARVDQTVAQMKAAEDEVKKAADTARKTAATAALFTCLSMLIGAFIASVAAAMGGRCRDCY